MRMTKTVLSEIVDNIVKATVEKKCLDAKALKESIGTEILRKFIELEGGIDAIDNLPKHYFDTTASFCVRVLNDVSGEYLNTVAKFQGNDADSKTHYIYCEAQRTPAAIRHGAFYVIGHEHPDLIRYREASELENELWPKVLESKNELIGMLKGYKSTEALIKALPDFEKYVPNYAKVSETKALAVRAEEITSYVEKLAA